jgi:polyhydroxyalkanoate synthesis regulator phasin
MSEVRDDCFKKEDRDELLKHGWQLGQIQTSLSDIKVAAETVAAKAENRLAKLEDRVRELENFKWIAWGAGTVSAILIGWIISIFGTHK